MRILVTGASGLLGINLAMQLSQAHKVFGVANQRILDPARLSFEVIQTDLLEKHALESVLEVCQPDWVIHCAALANLDACEANPELAAKLNTDLPRKLAELVAKGGARLVHISTDAVFDGLDGNYSEEDPPNPLGVYARTKYLAELDVQEFFPEAVVARVNLFGWSITGIRSLAEFFYNNLFEGKQVLGFEDVYFCPILVNDLADIFEDIFKLELSGLYHLVGSQCLTKYEFGKAIAKRFDLDSTLIKPASVIDSNLKAARSPNLTLKTDKLSKALGYNLPGFSTGLERLYTLYQQGYPQELKKL